MRVRTCGFDLSRFAVAWGGMKQPSCLVWVSWHWALDVHMTLGTGEGFGPLLHECAATLADVDAGCGCEHALTRVRAREGLVLLAQELWGSQLIGPGWACYLVSVLKLGMVWG